MVLPAHSRPSTLVVCGACGNAGLEDVMTTLRQAVRACPHGVMVSTACLGRFLRCGRKRVLYAAVQPCTGDNGGAVAALGPLVDEADAETVAAWLKAGMSADGEFRLAEHLPAAPAPQWVAHHN
ncbi:hypothetical protein [Streptomyces sp. NPDC006285]|uniref:hypothetical protein n=1 Tax=Streptomyces sp. NPDC006285 TaxID=3364742 RepID=UPI0036983EAA